MNLFEKWINGSARMARNNFLFDQMATGRLVIRVRGKGYEKVFPLLVILIWGTVAFGQNKIVDRIDSIKLAKNIFLIRTDGKIGNPNCIAMIGDDEVFLVDASFSYFGSMLTRKLAELGGKRVRYVVNTHWHGDHTAGNENFGKTANVIARTNVRKRLLNQGILEDKGRPITKYGLPNMVSDSRIRLYFDNEEIEIIPMPTGHTDGDIIVYFKNAKVLAVGDYFFLDRFPVIDLDGSAASLKGYLRNIKTIIDDFPKDIKIAPGHSAFQPKKLKAATIADLENYYQMLSESMEYVRRQIALGKKLKEIQQSGLPEKFRKYSEKPRFVSEKAWISTIYKSEQNSRVK